MVDQGMNKKLMIDFANCTQLNFLIFPESISPMQAITRDELTIYSHSFESH